ncbi:MAG: YdcF family protein [Rhodospirillales bacterium]|nr:YdcF family protein [Rhodospirillales bacterium]
MGYERQRTAGRGAGRCRSRYRRLLPAAGLTALVVAFTWASGLIRFADAIPSSVVDTETPTDAIVVLTGGSERLATGVSLLARGLAERVFVSGVHPDVDAAEMLKAVGEGRAELIGRIDAGHGARDTAGNATETAAWLQDHGYQSLRLVTASYHMPRSLLEFSRALPDATIVPHPVFPGHVMRRWWLWPGSAALIIGEYHKFLWSWLRLEVVHVAGARPAAEGTPA